MMLKLKKRSLKIYEVTIIILSLILVGAKSYPASVSKKTQRQTIEFRDHLQRIMACEVLFIQGNLARDYDNNLARVIHFITHNSIWFVNQKLAALRDSLYFELVRDFYGSYKNMVQQKASEVTTQLFARRTEPSAQREINEIVTDISERIRTYPTFLNDYTIAKVDTAGIRRLRIFCPITPTQVDSSNNRF